MRRRERYKHLLNLCANFILLLSETAMFAWVWYQLYVPSFPPEDQFWRRGNWAVIGIYAMVLFFFSRTFGAYRIGYLRITDICLSQILSILFANAIEYFQICMIANDYVNVGNILLLTVAEMAVVLPSVYVVRYFYVRLYPPRKMIVIYGEHSPEDLISKINSREDKYDVCATASAYIGYEALYTKILDYEAVVLCDLPTKIRNKILKFCYDQNKRTYITPKISDIIVTGTERIHLFDTPLMLCRNQGFTIEQRFVKVDSEEKGAQLAKKEDDRITPVGKIIRRTHLDELPQLFNILKGEMSFVGPRPERQVIAEKYEDVVPEFRFRLKVKAGLTGYAQVYGKYNTTPYDKLKLDLTYIENYSAWLDLKLMLMTVKVMFQKENTEGVEEKQVTAIKKE